MEACLGLGRSQRNLNKPKQKDLKLQDQQQQQHTQLKQQQQQTQAIITNQNYYTRQQQPQNQRYLVARGQTTNVGALKPELEQQQHKDESHFVRQEKQQKVQHNAITTLCTTATTRANMQQASLSTANDSTGGVGSVVQEQPQPQTTSFQNKTITAEVTPTMPFTVSPANISGIATNVNVKTFRKINRQAQHQPQEQRQQQYQHHLHQQHQLEVDLDAIEECLHPEPHVSFKGAGGLLRQTKTLGCLNHQQQHHHSIKDHHGQWTQISSLQLLQLQQLQQQQQQQHKYHHQEQQQLKADLDAIEVCVDPEPHVSFKSGGGLLRQSKTLGRFNHQHQHHHSIEDQHGQCKEISSLQLLQLQQQQQQQHDYSYAYYEPGAVIRHTNIPHAELMAGAHEEEDLIPPPPNSIRALLLKGNNNKLLVSPTTRESYQIRLTHQQNHNEAMASDTPENFYEEISASSTSSSSNSMTSPHRLKTNSHLAGTLTRTLVEEELRRVQNTHDKIIGELNLSVEAMLMPESLQYSSPTAKEPPKPAVSVTLASGQPLRVTSSSAGNICDRALEGGPADDFISPIPNSTMVSAGLSHSSCVAADLDSGFSGSSGASYIGSLRLHKTIALMSSRSNTTTAATGGNAAAKSQQSSFAYATQSCRSFQRAKSNNTNAIATATSATLSTAASATTSSCTIKHLPQIHHNIKQQKQQQLHMQHQHHHHHDSHQQHYHLHRQQQHPHLQHQQSQHVDDDFQNSSGFFTRASCGCRILNCAKIRAAEDPGPVVPNARPKESKARSFWNRKGWRKLPGFSTSTSDNNDPG